MKNSVKIKILLATGIHPVSNLNAKIIDTLEEPEVIPIEESAITEVLSSSEFSNGSCGNSGGTSNGMCGNNGSC